MKILFFIFILILYSTCIEFTLKAGTKTEGFCHKGDFIFIYENSFYVNDKSPKEEYDFKLLMEKNIGSICKPKKRNLSNKFEIICKIKKYGGCYDNFSFSIPRLGNLEPEKKFLKNGDIIVFEGFKESGIIKKEKNENKFSNEVSIELKAGFIAKKVDNSNDVSKQFFIINNTFQQEEITKDKLEDKKFKIQIELDNDNNKQFEATCYFDEINKDILKNEKIENVNITCDYKNENEKEPDTILILKEPDISLSDGTQIKSIDFENLIFCTVILGKIEKGSCNSNKYFYYLKNTTVSKELPSNTDFYFNVYINEEEKKSKCTITNNKNLLNVKCFIDGCFPENNEIIYKEGNFFNYGLLNQHTIYFQTNGDISTSTLVAGYILKDSCSNGIYSFLIGGNKLYSNLPVIKGNFMLKMKEFSNGAECEIIENIYHTIKCKVEVEKETEYCNNIYKDITIEKIKDLISDKYILIEGNNILYMEGFEYLQTFTVKGGNLFKGKCNNNIYSFNFSESEIYNNNLTENEIYFILNILSNTEHMTANCSIIIKDNNITCKIVGTDFCPIIDIKNDLKIEKNPNDLIISKTNKRIKFYDFEGKSTIATISAGKLKYDNLENGKLQLIFEDSIVDYTLNKNIDFELYYELNGKENKTKCTFVLNKAECGLDGVEIIPINIKILKEPKDDYYSLEEKTIIYKGFQGKKIDTLTAGKIKKGKCKEENPSIYIFSFEKSSISLSLQKGENFILRMKEPDKNVSCVIPPNIDKDQLFDIECKIVEASQCPYFEDEVYDLRVDIYEPEPIKIDESFLYFSSFSKQNTSSYTISVNNIQKNENNKIDGCEYYFYLSYNLEPEYLIEDIQFHFNLSVNTSQYTSNCVLYNNSYLNNASSSNSELLSCYFVLDSEMCNSDDILNYNLKIGENIDETIQPMNKYQNVVFKGFNNKELVNVYIQNFIEKIKDNDAFIFKLSYNNYGQNIAIDNKTFTMGLNNGFDSVCSFINDDVDKYIKCQFDGKSLNIESDIKIEIPKYETLNSQTIYFNNDGNLKTYSIIAGKIQKVKCKEEQKYEFNIIVNNIPNDIPHGITFNLNITLINNDKENGKKEEEANCSVVNKNINCKVKVDNCSSINDIILNDISSISQDSIFYYGFNNKRTYTIKAGKIKKGFCSILPDKTKQYTFHFKNNTINYEKDAAINIKLSTISNSNNINGDFNGLCNIKNENNSIVCNVNFCPENGEDDILIASSETEDYTKESPNTLWYEGFSGSRTITIRNEGKIIKENYENNICIFKLTDNIINDSNYLKELTSLEIEITDAEKNAQCNIIQPIEDSNKFDMNCEVKFNTMKEIIIKENPTNENYYFTGYNGKRTLTIEAGTIEKIDNKSFYIVKNKFLGNVTDISLNELNIIIDIMYNNEKNINASCIFGPIYDTYIDIKCTCDAEDLQTIRIINNPIAYLLSDDITTLNFINYINLSLYSLNLGKILKDGCRENSLVLYFVNTTLSQSINNFAYFNLPVKINEKEDKTIRCQLNPYVDKFKMYCTINNYCPTENIDIKVEKNNINKIIPSLSPNTVNLNISEEILSTTLIIGYLKKIKCANNIYLFTINGNSIGGYKIDMIDYEYKLKISQFSNEAICSINRNNLVSTCTLEINAENQEEKSYCENIYKDIKSINKIGDNYIIINNNIVNFYGFEKLETFTVVAGDLKRGSCINNIYKFNISNSMIYNNLLNTAENTFSLKLRNPSELNVKCILPFNLSKDEIFDIECSYQDDSFCPTFLDRDLKVAENEPNDIIIDSKRVMFRNFINISSIVTIDAGLLTLEKDKNNIYYLQFSNSNIDYKFTKELKFTLQYELNGNNKIEKCECVLPINSLNITCQISNLKDNDIYIKILKNPNDNYEDLDSKTIIFNNFADKGIYKFIAGQIKAGNCGENSKIYTFYFNNSKCNYELENNFLFYLQMNKPKKIAICTPIKIQDKASEYDVICNINGTSTCPVEDGDEISVNEKDEPSASRINDKIIIYFSSFSNQSSNNENYNIYCKTLTKNNVSKKSDEVIYKFNIADCQIDKNLELESISFESDIQLSLYDEDINKELNSISCSLKEGLYIKSIDFDIECSFTTNINYYREDDNYDIQMTKLDKKIQYKNYTIHIDSINDLQTITLHGCELSKGQSEDNIYNYAFSNCILPKKLSSQIIEFTLNTKNNYISNCVFTSQDPSTIQCKIDDYNENYIEIGENNPIINYEEYKSDKNFYISGLNSLSVSTLNAGELILGCCESNNYSFSFKNSQISNQLSSEINFSLKIQNSSEQSSICAIPTNIKNLNDFELKCTIKGNGKCPISDEYSLQIEEITEEKKIKIDKTSIYLNNFKNRERIYITAGDLTLGECEGNKYKFNFINSKFEGNGLEELQSFAINLTNPKTEALCNLNNNENEINCYIEGEEECPLYLYTHIETGENDPYINNNLKNKIIYYSNFKNKKKLFPNYYISISEYKNNLCINEKYEFDLIATFKSDISDNYPFSLNLTNNEINIPSTCFFSDKIIIDTSNNIHCTINQQIDSNLKLNFDKIYIKEKKIYIINLGNKKSFEFQNVECPLFSIDRDIDDTDDIEPENKTSNNSFTFMIKVKTSFKDKKNITILDGNGKNKDKNILEFNLIPSNYLGRLLLFDNIQKEEENYIEYIVTCEVPSETEESLIFDCSANDVDDKTSDYFQLEDTKDKIQVDNTIVNLKGITELKIKNIFKSDPEKETEEEEKEQEEEKKDQETEEEEKDSEEEKKDQEAEEEEKDSEEEKKDQETEEEEKDSDSVDPVNPDQDDEPTPSTNGGMSTAGKVILIIVLILVFILIILILLYFFYFKKKEKIISDNNTSENDGKNSTSQLNKNKSNQKKNNENGEEYKEQLIKNKKEEEEENSFENDENLKKKKKRKIKSIDNEHYDYE